MEDDEHEDHVKVAIIGSRDFNDYDLLCKTMEDFVKKYGKPCLMVSGGARGADTLGERWAKDNSIEKKIFLPNWSLGKCAGILRNHDIINAATHVVAFPSVKSRGTTHSISLARKARLPLIVVKWDRQ